MFLLNILKSTLLASALLLTNAAHAQLAEVVSFTPQGETRRIQQVAVRFSADMVKLGESDAAVPVTLNCPQGNAESPTGRWVDTRRPDDHPPQCRGYRYRKRLALCGGAAGSR